MRFIAGKLKLRCRRSTLSLEQGFSGSEIVVQIHKALLDLDISDQTKVQLINSVGEIDFRLSEGPTKDTTRGPHSRIRASESENQRTST